MPLAGIGGSRNFAQEKAKLGFQKSWRDVCQKILRWCPSKRLLRSDATFPWIFLVVCLEEEAYLRLSILRQQLWIYDRDERMNLSLYGVYRRAVRYRDLAQGLTFWRKVLTDLEIAEATGLTLGGVRSASSRGLAALRNRLEGRL